jgi:hypothetical protein
MKISFILLFLSIPSFGFAFIASDSDQVTCKRNLLIQKDKIIVTLILEKPKVSGFARIYEKLPSGSTVSKIKCGNAVYKNEKSMLKFAWESIPESELIEITYELKLKEPLNDTLNSITGTFSAEFLPLEMDQIPITSGTKEYQKTEVVQYVKTEPDKEEKKKTEFTSSSIHPLTKDDGIYICIQVAALSKNVKSDYLKKQFGYEGEFESHFEENLYRVTVGKFKSQAEAEAVLKEYKEKYFKKCFLSAYKNGHKIPVYEAEKLMN